ncbi:hypothetical protein BZM27_43370 [Paraburkholderia steynii]|uniref:Uncharacterized protein n=1 Tax=Paraburkholderia steynii TaxID=1245441 RepID=A0A4R0XBE7_9BURK|nr:hypothetical protein BZM27_43370 [Paraburkholderia steynii]
MQTTQAMLADALGLARVAVKPGCADGRQGADLPLSRIGHQIAHPGRVRADRHTQGEAQGRQMPTSAKMLLSDRANSGLAMQRRSFGGRVADRDPLNTRASRQLAGA